MADLDPRLLTLEPSADLIPALVAAKDWPALAFVLMALVRTMHYREANELLRPVLTDNPDFCTWALKPEQREMVDAIFEAAKARHPQRVAR
ncbi:MAG: hypothetical protein JSS14_22020 [Proteobacteria bacterium]|nr:hypothetical protein [Pseudomonadota bacterium]